MPSIYALKRKHKKLQEEYDLKGEELRRLRKAHTIETDPSQKFKFEKQIEQLEEKRKQLEQELEKSEHQIEVILSGVEGPPFQWDYSKFPINFSSKVDFLTQYFVGRQEAIEKIEQFIQTHKSGYLAVVGEAGIGKSALLAHEVKKRGAVHHFVDDKQNSAKDEVFLRCIVEQLRQKYDFEFGERMPISVSKWNIYFQKWMKEISTEEKLVICVDALDEAQHYGGSDNLLKYLPHELPENVYFILTSRPEFKKEDITFSDSTVFECYNLPPLTQADIEAYLTQRFPSFLKGGQGGFSDIPLFPEGGPGGILGGFSEIAAILYQKSEGNPLYLYYLLQECDDENLTLEQVNQLPQGLMKFYEKQWCERIWIGDKSDKEGRKQILCLLLILKEPPSEEMLLELTDFDRAELQEYLTPLRRFMRTGERYDFFHDSFRNFLQYQLEKAISAHREKLIERLWNWRKLKGELFKYALCWLPTHLLEAKQYNRLFMLAKEAAFRQAQAEAFPDNPELLIRTLQTALQGAVDSDDTVKIAEFLLIHAQHMLEITIRENPLEALDKGNLQRAWKLVDLYDDIEYCVKWYLLLIWVLKDRNRMQEAQETLHRLQEKKLPQIIGEDSVFMLFQTYDVDEQGFFDLCQRLIDSPSGMKEIAKFLDQAGAWEQAQAILFEARRMETAHQIENEYLQTKGWKAIAAVQTQWDPQGGTLAGMATALEFPGWYPGLKFFGSFQRQMEATAAGQARAGKRKQALATFAAALSADQIDNIMRQAKALEAIAAIQTQMGDHQQAQATLIEAQKTIDQLGYGKYMHRHDYEMVYGSRTGTGGEWNQEKLLEAIVEAQKTVHQEKLLEAIVEAQKTVHHIEREEERAKVLYLISTAQIKAGCLEQALETTKIILTNRNELLPKIAEDLVEAGDKIHFKQLLLPCASYLDAAYQMCGLLARLYPEQATAIAEVVIKQRQQKRNISKGEQTA